MGKTKTNEVVSWINERLSPLYATLGIETVIQGDFTSLPAPDKVSEWCNILIIKPGKVRIAPSEVEGLYRVDYFMELYFLRKFTPDEPINESLVNDTEMLTDPLFVIEEEEERFADDSLVIEALPTDIDYSSDVEGMLRALDLDVTASKINFQLKAEH